jgi:hypothetical protein
MCVICTTMVFFIFEQRLDIVLAYGEACGSSPRARRIFLLLLLVGGKYLKDLVYSIPIDTTEDLRERVENSQ